MSNALKEDFQEQLHTHGCHRLHLAGLWKTVDPLNFVLSLWIKYGTTDMSRARMHMDLTLRQFIHADIFCMQIFMDVI